MALPLPAAPSGGAGSLQLRVLGFPVSVHASFYVLTALFAFAGGLTLAEGLAWLLVVGVSILVHELGHAVLARRTGATPTIQLYAMGGVTYWSPPAPPSRVTTIGVSVAGPATGMLVGAGLLGVAAVTQLDAAGVADFALDAAIYVNLGWGLLNLLPILPLDGGHVLMSLLPGDADRRARTASIVSVATGAATAVVAGLAGVTFGAVLAAYFAVTNLTGLIAHRGRATEEQFLAELREAEVAAFTGSAASALETSARVARSTRDLQLRLLAERILLTALVLADRSREAMTLALDAESPVDPAMEGLLLVATGQRDLGLARLSKVDVPPAIAPTLAVALARQGVDVGAHLLEVYGPQLSMEVASAAQTGLFSYGHFDEAAGLGERMLAAAPGPAPTTAYNTACAWARAGDVDRGLAALRRAIDDGFDDQSTLLTDPDLDALRADSRFPGG